MSGPILTGLATLVREYFFEGYGPSLAGAAGRRSASGVRRRQPRRRPPAQPVGRPRAGDARQRRRPHARPVHGRRRPGRRRSTAQYPSAGPGLRPREPRAVALLRRRRRQPASQHATWYHDVWRADDEAFEVSLAPPVRRDAREYEIEVAAGRAASACRWCSPTRPARPASGAIVRVNDLDLVVERPRRHRRTTATTSTPRGRAPRRRRPTSTMVGLDDPDTA